MTTATTAAELKIVRDARSAAHIKLVEEYSEVRTKITAAARARNSGEVVFQQQRERELPDEIVKAKEAADIASVRFVEARNAEGFARLEQERLRKRYVLDQRKPTFRKTLVAFARGAAELRRDAVALQAVEEQLGQNLGPLRTELQAEAVFIEVFASKIAQWLRDGAERDAQWSIIDQVTGVEGAALRAARDAFFGK